MHDVRVSQGVKILCSCSHHLHGKAQVTGGLTKGWRKAER
jgi:hypothetical protein